MHTQDHSLVLSFVDHRDTGVMADPGQLEPRGGEGHTLHPATSTIGVLSHDGSKRHLLTPGSGLRLLLNLLHIGREHSVGTWIVLNCKKDLLVNFG